MLFRTASRLGLWFATCTLGSAAWAADPITDAIQAAYAPYRVALFKTNANQASDAAQALQQARQGWSQVTQLSKVQPTVPYANDDLLARTLSGVDALYAKALQEVAAGQLPEAHETLEGVRDLLSELRRQNQVVVYSDHMNAYHAQMEHLLVEGPKWLAAGDGLPKLTAQSGVLAYLAERLATEAPERLKTVPEFQELLAAVSRSVGELSAAMASGDKARMGKALSMLKGPYGKLYLRFG